MSYCEIPLRQQPLREGVRGNTNHHVSGCKGGSGIDLRRFAAEGKELFGRLVGFDASAMRFELNLRVLLAEADRICNGNDASIDLWIAELGIDVPPPTHYAPVWEPKAEGESLTLSEAGLGKMLWRIVFRPDFGWLNENVIEARGITLHLRSVTTQAGLYFIGLPWLHPWGSERFSGLARGAAFVAEQVAASLPMNRTEETALT